MENGDLFSGSNALRQRMDEEDRRGQGPGAWTWCFPILVLIVCCVIGMIYSGGFFDGGRASWTAFSNSDASVGLLLGSVVALVFTVIYFIVPPRP